MSGKPTAVAPQLAPRTSAAPSRLVSLDAYRGLVMLAMASHGLGIPAVAKQFPDNPIWPQLAFQTDHVAWIGCCFWDLIQPSFMFMVGVAMAYSCAARQGQGQSYGWMTFHAAWRAIALILLGIFLRSNGKTQTNFTFDDVTTQIGLGYFFLFLLWNRPRWVQWSAAGTILVGYWALFFFWPLPGADYDYAKVGVSPDLLLPGHLAHWNKNANPAHYFDVWFMNLFPRPVDKPFLFSGGGYQTLSFIPSLATMIFGLLAGELLRSPKSAAAKFGWLVLFGLLGLGIGYGLNEAWICPVVKRIWTPSWAIYAGGWTCLMLATFYAIIELANCRTWAFPLVVVGANSVAIYCMTWLIGGWIERTLTCHLGEEVFNLYLPFPVYRPIIHSTIVLLVYWLILLWMYRRKIFLKI